MTFLILGLAVFIGVHFIPLVPAVRGALVARIGEKPYKRLFVLTSFAGLGLIIYGYGQKDIIDLWGPEPWAREVAMALMPLVIILLTMADMKTVTRQKLRHPMMIGVLAWATIHLLNNGDLASLMLFGSFAAYAVISVVSAEIRGHRRGDGRAALKYDIMAVVGGCVLYAVILYAHGFLFGMPVLR